MRKIKIKEKNHNLRIKYKEGEWQSAVQHYAQQPHR